MLVLSRHRDEWIVIKTPEGRTIKVLVVELRSDKVRLGVTADTEVTVHRHEVQAEIDKQNADEALADREESAPVR